MGFLEFTEKEEGEEEGAKGQELTSTNLRFIMAVTEEDAGGGCRIASYTGGHVQISYSVEGYDTLKPQLIGHGFIELHAVSWDKNLRTIPAYRELVGVRHILNMSPVIGKREIRSHHGGLTKMDWSDGDSQPTSYVESYESIKRAIRECMKIIPQT